MATKTNTNKQTVQAKADLQLVRNLWSTYINKTVSWSLLNKVLNGFIADGFETDYLIFVMKYIIDHHKNLNHPFGLKYYVNDQAILDTYKKSKLPKIDTEQFKVKEPQTISPPRAVSTPKRVTSFADILGGGNK